MTEPTIDLGKRLGAMQHLGKLARDQELNKAYEGIEYLKDIRNFPEFAKQQIKIVNKAGELVPFILNNLQRRILAAELRVRRQRKKPWLLILKYRKGGVTTLQQALSYHTIWSQRNASCLTTAHEPEATRDIFRMVTGFYEYQPERHRHDKTAAQTYHVEFPLLRSWYKAENAGKNTGRGQTHARIHVSEAAFVRYLTELHTSLSESQRNDCAYILESTANGRDGDGKAFYDMWKAAEKGMSKFTPLFFPWYGDPTNTLPIRNLDEFGELSKEEKDVMDRFDLSLEQVHWWRDKRLGLAADGRSASKVYQEHPFTPDGAFIASGTSYYDGRMIDEAHKETRDPIPPGELKQRYGNREGDLLSGHFRIWEEPKKGARYVIAVDPAEGVGADSTAIVGINADTGEQAFSWERNDMAPEVVANDVLGRKGMGLGWLWKTSTSTPAYVIVERQNHGHAFLVGLLKQAGYPVTSVHHDEDVTRSDGSRRSSRAGWSNNPTELKLAVASVLRDRFPRIRDSRTVDSINGVTEHRGEPRFGGQDLAVAIGMSHIALRYMPGPPPKFAFIGGRMVDLENLTYVEDKKTQNDDPEIKTKKKKNNRPWGRI